MAERILFKSDRVEVGEFTITPDDPDFDQPGYVDSPIVVFPKTTIWIEHEDSQPFVADPTLVNFYNEGQSYRRYAISQKGDRCHWIRLDRTALSQVFGQSRLEFAYQYRVCPASVFVVQVALIHDLLNHQKLNQAVIENTVMGIFQTLFNHQINTDNITAQAQSKHVRLVEAVKASLQHQLHSNLTLAELAHMHHTSPYHLSRVFKQVSGIGINHYRTRCRLHQLSLKLHQNVKDLTQLALEFGFSSHSHMSACFKATFGISPRRWQEQFEDS